MALRQVLNVGRRALLPVAYRAATGGEARMVSTSIRLCANPAVLENFGADAPSAKKHCGWGQTKVWDVIESKPDDSGAWLWCSKDDLVIDAVRKMTNGNVGSLLVFDPSKINLKGDVSAASSDAVVGIVTERDYLTKVVVLGKNSSQINVSSIMTPQSKLMTVSPDSSVLEVMALMVNNNFRHVPVVYQNKYLGMVSIRDVVGVMYQEHKEEVGRLHEYIQGSY